MAKQKLLYEFDMGGVKTRDDFQREMGKHFQMSTDHVQIWPSISHGLLALPTACTFRFRGWAEFEQSMPSYAGRLRRMIQSFQKVMSEETYTIEYA